MGLFKLDENVNSRYSQLLGESILKDDVHLKSFFVEGSIYDPWLEDVEWVFLNDLKEDYEGVKINSTKNRISFLFIDEYARNKALNILETRFKEFNIKTTLVN